MTPRLLVVDDEPSIRRLVLRALGRGDYALDEAATAAETLALARARAPDLVLLDLGLPDRDGLELIPQLIEAGCTILILSARDDSAEKVAALDLGADDYITKPFDTDELLARVRACLRHRAGPRKNRLSVGDVTIDLDLHQVRKAGVEVHLTPKEYDLLAELVGGSGRVLTHRHLLRSVWGDAHESDIEYLRVAVRSIRRKLEDDPARPRLIRNEPGIGYRAMTDA